MAARAPPCVVQWGVLLVQSITMGGVGLVWKVWAPLQGQRARARVMGLLVP